MKKYLTDIFPASLAGVVALLVMLWYIVKAWRPRPAGMVPLFLVLLAASACGQTHSVALSWNDSINPATLTTYNVYRVAGACTTTTVFGTALKPGVSGLAYTDTTVVGKTTYCYLVSAVLGGIESTDANGTLNGNPTVTAIVPADKPLPPTGLVVITVK